MKKKGQLILAAWVLILATLACTINQGTPTPVPPTPIPATPVPTAGSLTVVNNTGGTIFYLYVSPTTSSTWGEDVLGASTISNGGSFTLEGVAPGTYDLMAEDANHTTIETWMGVDIRGPITWTVTGSGSPGGTGTAQLTIYNNSGVDIWYAYISPSTSTEWGEDWLGVNTIPAGDEYTITGIPEGTYDMKVEDSDHNILETRMGVTLTGEMEWTVTGAGGGGGGNTGGGTGSTLTIINNTGRDIGALFIAAQNSAGWGINQLGTDTIPNGTDYSITDIPPGLYDVRVNDTSNATITIINAVNLNSDFTLTLTP